MKQATKTATTVLIIFIVLWVFIIALAIASIYAFLTRHYALGAALGVIPLILLIVFIVLKIRNSRKKG